jgi:hypothetical protein
VPGSGTAQPSARIRELAQARAAARSARDWAEADRLRAEIEAAGWRVVDHGSRFELSPAAPADVVEGERVRYGRSGSVPSRLEEPTTAEATVVIRATDAADDLRRLLEGLRRHAPSGTQVVIVADAPSAGVAAALEAADGPAGLPIGGLPPEMVWTVERLGPAGAANAGLRRAVGRVVILLDPSVEPTGNLVTPLVRALDDPSVAAAGAWGTVSPDLRHWEDASPGDVDAVDGAAMAFRRDDVVARGPLDEGYRSAGHLATWWSLVLRDEGEGSRPRRAVRLAGLPVVRHEPSEDASIPPAERARLDKRGFYRLLERFGRRRDLLVGGPGGQGDRGPTKD